MSKKIRPFGEILLDLEEILEEMIDTHDVQAGDILSQIYTWVTIHRPEALEVYTKDNTNPEFYYGARRERK